MQLNLFLTYWNNHKVSHAANLIHIQCQRDKFTEHSNFFWLRTSLQFFFISFHILRTLYNIREVAFLGRCGRHQESYSLPEVGVPGSGSPCALWPPDGGALTNQILQSGGKLCVSLRPSVSQLDQNHTHLPLNQRMMESNLGHDVKKISCILFSPSQNKPNVCLLIYPPTKKCCW